MFFCSSCFIHLENCFLWYKHTQMSDDSPVWEILIGDMCRSIRVLAPLQFPSFHLFPLFLLSLLSITLPKPTRSSRPKEVSFLLIYFLTSNFIFSSDWAYDLLVEKELIIVLFTIVYLNIFTYFNTKYMVHRNVLKFNQNIERTT